MNTNLKVILAAVSLATLASPVMAESWFNNAYNLERPAAADISNAHGSVAGAPHTARTMRSAPVTERSQVQVGDAVHVPFPQQDNGN